MHPQKHNKTTPSKRFKPIAFASTDLKSMKSGMLQGLALPLIFHPIYFSGLSVAADVPLPNLTDD